MTDIKPHVWPELTEPKFGEWHPIDTAPKDGTRVLLSNKEHVGVGQWIVNLQSGYHYNDWFSLMLNQFPYSPTHWTPLPAPSK